MEGTKPLDRLIIQGSSSTSREESLSKKVKGGNLQLSLLPDIASSNQLFKTFPGFRRYAFPGRETHSEYGGRISAQESGAKFLKVRGKTIYWDSEMSRSSANQSDVGSHGGSTSSCVDVTGDRSSPNGFLDVTCGDKVNPPGEHSRDISGEGSELYQDKSYRPYILDRNSRLRHSYHGVGSLTLTGQKLTTPRDFDKNIEKPSSDSLPGSVPGWEEPFSEPNISAMSPRHMRHDRAELSHRIAPPRAVHSALLKQCLRIQKPKLEDEDQPETSLNESKKPRSTPITTKETRGNTEMNKHLFDSLHSYITYNHKQTIDTGANLGANILGTRTYGSANGHSAPKVKTETRPNSFTTVKKFPNLNGYTDFKHLSITGSSPAVKPVHDSEANSSNGATLSTAKPNFQVCKENVRPVETAAAEGAENRFDGSSSDLEIREPSLTCTPLQKKVIFRTPLGPDV